MASIYQEIISSIAQNLQKAGRQLTQTPIFSPDPQQRESQASMVSTAFRKRSFGTSLLAAEIAPSFGIVLDLQETYFYRIEPSLSSQNPLKNGGQNIP